MFPCLLLFEQNAATLAYNISIIIPRDDSEIGAECVSALTHTLTVEEDTETLYRILLSLKNLITANPPMRELAGLIGIENNMRCMEQKLDARNDVGGGRFTSEREKIRSICRTIEQEVLS